MLSQILKYEKVNIKTSIKKIKPYNIQLEKKE